MRICGIRFDYSAYYNKDIRYVLVKMFGNVNSFQSTTPASAPLTFRSTEQTGRCLMHLQQSRSSTAQATPGTESLVNVSSIHFNLWPFSCQLEPRTHKGPSFTLNVRTSSSPDPYYHIN